MLLLWKPPYTRNDGTTETTKPFMITYAGKTAYAGFANEKIADYFISSLKLDLNYRAVAFESIERGQLDQSSWIYLIKNATQVRKLVSAKLAIEDFDQALHPFP